MSTHHVYIFGPIGAEYVDGVKALDVAKELRDLPDDVDRVRVHVNSVGGSPLRRWRSTQLFATSVDQSRL